MNSALHSVEVWLVALVITVTVLGAFGAFARWCMHSAAVPQQKLDQLRVGMTAEEVTAVLGQPRSMRITDSGTRHWIYGPAVKRHVLLVEFNARGVVESFAHGVPQAKRAGKLPPWSAGSHHS